jgi:hypothetical protein
MRNTLKSRFKALCQLSIIAAAILLVACSAPVLKGPNYPTESSPFISLHYPGKFESMTVEHRLILIGVLA